MEKRDVIELFAEVINGTREKLTFEKGMETFEEVYNDITKGCSYLSKTYNLKRTEKPELCYMLVTITKGDN